MFRFHGLLEDEVFNELGEEYISSVEFFVRDAGVYGYFRLIFMPFWATTPGSKLHQEIEAINLYEEGNDES